LPNGEIRQKYPRCSRSLESGHERARPLLEAGVFEQAYHGQNEPDYRDIPARDEGFSECRDHREGTETAGDSGGQTGDGNDEERINPEDESDYHYQDTDE
jgi:hypothetical protein